MRIVPISEVFGLSSGETVPAIRGTVQAVFDQNSGTNAHGDWRLQNIVLKDTSGEVKVRFTDRDIVPPNWKGKVVCIECNEGGKGLTGIKAKDDEYRGKVSRILHVTPSAHVTVVEAQAAQQASQPPSGTPQPSAVPQSAPAPAPAANGNGVAISNAATLRARDYYRVMTAVQSMRQAWDKEHPQTVMTDAHFQAACSTVFIQLQRDGVINGH